MRKKTPSTFTNLSRKTSSPQILKETDKQWISRYSLVSKERSIFPPSLLGCKLPGWKSWAWCFWTLLYLACGQTAAIHADEWRAIGTSHCSLYTVVGRPRKGTRLSWKDYIWGHQRHSFCVRFFFILILWVAVFACTYVCTSHVCLFPSEAGRGPSIPYCSS